MKIPAIIISVVVALVCGAYAQASGNVPNSGYTVGANYAVVTDTDNLRKDFLEENGHMGYSLQWAYNTRPGGKNDVFNEILNFPVFGLGANFDVYRTMGFRNNSRVGNFVDLYGFMEASMYKNRWFSAGFLLDLGLSATNVVYDPIMNPGMINIGAPLTVFMAFGPQLKFRPADRLELALNAYWFHHSNGNAWMPNFGLNDLSIGVSARYNPGGAYTEQVRKLRMPHEFDRGLGVDVYATTGFHSCKTEFKAYNQMVKDPKLKKNDFVSHPRAGIGVDVKYRYCLMCSSGLVADGVYNWGVDELEKCDRIIYGDREVDECKGYSPFNMSLGLFHEFHYRSMSVFCAMCAYVFRKVGIYEDGTRFFQRAGMRFYMPRLSNMFLGCCIRATKFNNADYFEFQMGVKI